MPRSSSRSTPSTSTDRTVLLLFGPKAAGKSWVARVAERRLGVHHVDADQLVLDLLAADVQAHPTQGWLVPVRSAVLDALAEHGRVSVEATGAWDSDWELARGLAAQGVRVLRVLVWTTKAESLRRLAARPAGRAPVTQDEAGWIHDAATARFAAVRWDARIDTSRGQDPAAIVDVLEPLLTEGRAALARPGFQDKTDVPRRQQRGRAAAMSTSSSTKVGGGESASGGLYGSAVGQVVRPAVAEFTGTFVLVFVGCSVAVAGALQRPVAGPPYDSLAVALAFGLTLAAVVAAIGHVSGGHVNPAVTIGQAVIGKFPWRQVPVWVTAQLLGAVLAALAVWACFGDAGRDEARLGATSLADGVGVGRGLLVEALITFILVFVVGLAASDPRVPSASIASLAVGFALAAGVFVGGPLTGGGVNPARALGPMLVAGELGDIWIYVVGPLIGGVAGAAVAAFVLQAFEMEQD